MSAANFKIAITWQIGNVGQVTNSVNQVQGAFSRLQGSAKTTAGSVGQFGSSVQGALPATRGLSAAATQSVGAHSAMAGAVGRSSSALGQFGGSLGTATQTLPKLTAAQQAAAGSNSNFAAKAQQTTQTMASYAGRIGGVAFMFGGLVAAMGEAQGMQEQLNDAQAQATAAQENLTRVTQQYGEGSREAAQAQGQLDKAMRYVNFASRIQRLSFQDQIFFLIAMVSQGIGPAVTAFGKFREAMATAAAEGKGFGSVLSGVLGTAWTKIKGGIDVVLTSLSNLNPAFSATAASSSVATGAITTQTGAISMYPAAANSATASTVSFSTALKGLMVSMLTNPLTAIIVGLTALGVALIALRYNVGGVRDAFNAAGKAIGDAVPALRPFLDAVKSTGVALGILPPQASAASLKIAELSKTTMTAEDAMTQIDEAWKKGETSLAALTEAFGGLRQGMQNSFEIIMRNSAQLAEMTTAFDQLTAESLKYKSAREELNAFEKEGAALSESLIAVLAKQGIAVKTAADAKAAAGAIELKVQEIEAQTAVVKDNLIRAVLEETGAIARNQDTLIGLTGAYNMIGGPIGEMAKKLGILQYIQQALAVQTTEYNNRLSAVSGVLQLTTGDLTNSAAAMVAVSEHLMDMKTGWDELPANILPAKEAMMEFAQSATTVERVQLMAAIIGNAEAFAKLPPPIQAVVTRFQDYVKSAHPVAGQSQVMMDALNELATAGGGTTTALTEIIVALDAFDATVINSTGGVQEITSVAAIFGDTLVTTTGEVIKIRDVLGTTSATVSETAKTFLTLAAGMEKVRQTQLKMARDRALAAMTETMDALGVSVDELVTKFPDLSSKIRDFAETNRLTTTQATYFWKTYSAQLQQTGVTWEEFIASAQTEGLVLEGTLDRLQAAQTVWSEAMKDGVMTAQEQDQVLAALNGTLTDSEDKTEELTTAIQDLATSNADAKTELNEWIAAMNEGTFATEHTTAGWIEAAKAQVDLAAEIFNTRGELEFYTEETNLANEMNMQFLAGLEGVELAIIKQAEALSRAIGELEGYIRALESGAPQALAFAEGQLKAEQSLLDLFLGLQNTSGELSQYGQQLADGRAQGFEFASGQLEVYKTILDNIAAISNLRGQISALNTSLKDAATVEFALGLQKGALAAASLTTEIAAANGEWLGFRNTLINTHRELDTFGNITGFTNEQLEQLTRILEGDVQALQDFNNAAAEARVAFSDFVESMDFDKLDDEMEDAFDKFQDNLDDWVDYAEEIGLEIPNAAINAMEFEHASAKVGDVMKEFWPTVQRALDSGDPDQIIGSINLFMAGVLKEFEDVDLPAAAQRQIDGIFANLDRLKTLPPDSPEFKALAQSILNDINNLAAGNPKIADTTQALNDLGSVSMEGLIGAAEDIAGLAEAVSGLEVTPEMIDNWAAELAKLHGVPVETVKQMLTQKMSETGASATSAFLEAGPGGDAARVALANQLAALADVFDGLANDIGTVFTAIDNKWIAFVALTASHVIAIGQQLPTLVAVFQGMQTDIGTVFLNISTIMQGFVDSILPVFTETLTTQLRTNLDEWGTWANEIVIVLESIGTSLTTFTDETIPTFTDALATSLRSNLDEWGRWANDITTVIITQVTDGLTGIVTAVTTMSSSIAGTLRSNLDEWGGWANDISGPVKSQILTGTTSMSASVVTMNQSMSGTLRTNVGLWNTWASGVVSAGNKAASGIVSAMNKIKSAAASATSSVKALQSAINSLKSKTITITVRYRTVGRPGLQHGGAFIASSPTTIGGHQVAEFSKPELVTVTPLTNPNNIQDKTIDLRAGAVKRAVTEDTSAGKKRSLQKEVLEPIFVTIDGEVIMKLVQKRLLEFAADNII